MSLVAQNIAAVEEQIAKCAKEWAREASAVNLVAASKLQPDDKIEAALAAGQRLFGENRVQEAQARWEERRRAYPDLRLHLIGPLQTNKVKEAVALFDCIETVDREKLVHELAKEMKKQGRMLPCFVQVNTGDEEQKAGVAVEALPTLLQVCEEAGLSVTGLMCIPPVDEPPALHFALLKKLAARHGLPELSMGMSADFEQAVALGATYVRVGTALFGARN